MKSSHSSTARRAITASSAALALTSGALALAAPASAQRTVTSSPRAERSLGPLVGAWRMTRLETGAPGRLQVTPYSGQFIFTRSGNGSVQALNPDASAPDTPFTLGGYEAYYGEVQVLRSRAGARGQQSGTFALTVRSAAARGIIGQRLTRKFTVTRDRLVITPTDPADGFRVTYRRF